MIYLINAKDCTISLAMHTQENIYSTRKKLNKSINMINNTELKNLTTYPKGHKLLLVESCSPVAATITKELTYY